MLNLINGTEAYAGHDLSALQNRIRRMHEPDQWTDRAGHQTGSSVYWVPRIDVVEDATSYRIMAELPGVAADQVTITVENNTLFIGGEKPEVSDDNVRIHRSERTFGAFERAFTLPSTADLESITATHGDGILTVSLAKSERAVARQIPVSTT